MKKEVALITIGVIIIICLLVVLWVGYRDYIYLWGLRNKLNKLQFGHLTIVQAQTEQILCDVDRKGKYTATIYVHCSPYEFCSRVARDGDIALGEMYVNGMWTTDNINNLMMIIVGNQQYIRSVDNNNTGVASYNDDSKDIQYHYDVGNSFYESFLLDDFMAYSCGFWFNNDDDLNSAQHNKVNTILRKMRINEGESDLRILDVGCGWGYIAKYIAEQTNSTVTGITLSNEQVSFINSQNNEYLNASICHYLDMPDKFGHEVFDRAYSIGMIEHVRCMNYDAFFNAMFKVMKDNGIFVLHTITTDLDYTNCNKGSSKTFVTRHIFPGGQIPKIEWILRSAHNNGFTLLHLETFHGIYYAKTLAAWKANMFANKENLQAAGYADKLIKVYEYYFTSCEAAFRYNQLQLSHFVFQKTAP